MKKFSLTYLTKSAHNAACQDIARTLVCRRFGIREISRREALRVGFRTGGELNQEVQRIAKTAEATPSFEEFAIKFAALCERHGVVFDGGIKEFLGGVVELRQQLGLENPFRRN